MQADGEMGRMGGMGWDGRRGVFTNHTVPVRLFDRHALVENKEAEMRVDLPERTMKEKRRE